MNPAQQHVTETVLAFSDPQIGFSTNASFDALKWALLADAASKSHTVVAAVVSGDIVDSGHAWNGPQDLKLFQSIWPSHFGSVPVHTVPGNHDIGIGSCCGQADQESATDAASTLRLRRRFQQLYGPVYSSFATRFARFVLVDSESLILQSDPQFGGGRPIPANLTFQMQHRHVLATDAIRRQHGSRNQSHTDHHVVPDLADDPVAAAGPEVSLAVHAEAQWDFIEHSLRRARAENRHAVLVMHRAPFLRDEKTEGGHFWVWPVPLRARLMHLARKHGCKLILAGHVHATSNRARNETLAPYAPRASGGIEILTTSGSAVAWDWAGCGYRTLSIREDTIEVTYTELKSASGKQLCPPGWAGWERDLYNHNVSEVRSHVVRVARPPRRTGADK